MTYGTRSGAPPGVKVLAGVAALDGLLVLLGVPGAVLLGLPGPIVAAIYLVVGLSELITAVGLVMLEPYAYSAAKWSYGVGLLLDVLRGNVVGAVLSLFVLGYLYLRREEFEKRPL